MKFYVGIPLVALALAFGASGIAAVARGWVLPFNRGRARNVRLFGWGQTLVALSLLGQGAFLLLLGGTSRALPPVYPVWSLVLLAGLALMGVSQRAGGVRRGR
ncbi:hypothetical protein ACWCPT_00230 [Streptomyces sp. NPDC002308]